MSEEKIRKGDRANQLLNDPVIAGFFSEMETDILDRLKAATMGSEEEQHEIQILRLLEEFKRRFNHAINGKTKSQLRIDDTKR